MRYFIGFLITIGLLIMVIFLLVHSGGSTKPKVPLTSKPLSSYAATDAEVSMTIDAPVNAQQVHQQVRITVNRDDVTFQKLQGYDGNAVETQHFANTENAYNAFLISLARAGFTKGDNNAKLRDETGYCPLGDRYIFELNQDGQQLERYWRTSCGGLKTYLGVFNLTVALFQNQVPGYDRLTGDVQL